MEKKKILLIDDDKEFLEELQEMLIMSGYDAVAASDGATAVELAREMCPDLILVDIKMPGLNGFQVADRLKQFLQTKDISIVAMSGHFTKEEHLQLMNALGIRELIKKPLRPLDVISQIEKFT